jgi:hypothetical protein
MATSTSPVEPAAPGAPGAPPSAEPDAGARRRRIAIAVVTLLVLALVAVGVLGLVAYQRAQAQAQAELDQAVAALEPVATELSEWVSASEEALASAGTATEETRTGMAEAIESARALDTTPPEDGSRAERTAAVERIHEQALAEIEAITGASTALAVSVYESQPELDVAFYHDRRGALEPALAAGEQAWAAGTGDAADREALRSALDAAVAVRDTPVEMTDQYLLADLAMQLDTARADVEAATAAVAG